MVNVKSGWVWWNKACSGLAAACFKKSQRGLYFFFSLCTFARGLGVLFIGQGVSFILVFRLCRGVFFVFLQVSFVLVLRQNPPRRQIEKVCSELVHIFRESKKKGPAVAKDFYFLFAK